MKDQSIHTAEALLGRKVAQLQLLNDIGRQIAAELELDSVLDRAACLMQERFGYHHVAVFTVDRERGELVMRARAGFYTHLFPLDHRLRLGQGLVGWVARHGKTLLVNDVSADSRYVNLHPDVIRTRSELSVPIQIGQKVEGVLDVQGPQTGAFDDDDLMVIETLAGQIAVAMRNSELDSQIQQQLEELALLSSASRIMVSSLDRETVLETTMRQAIQVLQVEAGSVLLLDPDTGDLVFEAAYGGGAKELKGRRLPPRQGIAGWVAQHGVSLTVPDVQADDRFYSWFDADSGFTTCSILCVPLITRGQTIGVMQALNKVGRGFTTDDRRLLESLASAAAIAIENARLYDQVQQELRERIQAEESLNKERASLAQRVEERTAELRMTNAELARVSHLKDEFLANMSHELRTPLNAILGMTEALRDEIYGALGERQSKAVGTIEESGRHLLNLISDILDLSKTEAGEMKLEIVAVSVESACQASLQLVRQMTLQKRLKVSLTLDSGVTILEADERRLKQILINLLSNAVKFTPEGGELGLEVVGDGENKVVRFTVWDTGIGIAPEDAERLFKPFTQLDSSLSRRYEGTGLGLSLVHRLAEMHGGGVSLESQVGVGSRFTVSLPWREPGQGEQERGRERGIVEPGSPVRLSPFSTLLCEVFGGYHC